jgi:hypothetical protein
MGHAPDLPSLSSSRAGQSGTAPRNRKRRYCRPVLRWLCALLVATVVSGFAFLLLTGRYISEGPVLVRVSRTHGVHAGDVLVIGAWGIAIVAVFLLAFMSRRDDTP